ncbi:stealth family protein [Vibrio algicola]|uniref:Uncharacterized protein n=1 Tax=Vibrio algicola TaxID=2662262 RepID=A0A5Q0TFU9_9VIBR|nr:stealth family protein [Vibrio algicola]
MSKIDIVYTWIDGSDQAWNKKKDAYLKNCQVFNNCQSSQAGSERYTDHQELKFSLRSIAMFAPWVNHIYIITDNQKPTWLSCSSKVTVIDHKDIIPIEYLPTFNSSVIEAHIHNIKDLQEKFIYFNDDMFLGKPTFPRDFFVNNKPLVFTSSIFQRRRKRKASKDHTYNVKSINSSRDMAESSTKKYVGYGIKHGIRPLLKSRLLTISQLYSDILQPHYTEKFRLHPFSLLYLYTFHELALKNAKPKYLKNAHKKSILPLYSSFLYITDKNIHNLESIYIKNRPLVFCLNEITDNIDRISFFSDGIFSKKSEFEL